MAALRCSCGVTRFRVRLQRDEQVGLLTCEGKTKHSSLLLDSRDYWHDVIQNTRPRESRCRCGERVFEVELDYELREDNRSIRSIDVRLRCAKCAVERTSATFEIDYEPTDDLRDKPLDPCADPWLKARQTEVSALWARSDLDSVIRHLAKQNGVRCWFAGWRERPREQTAREACAAWKKANVFDLFFAAGEVSFPEQLRDCWTRLPVIHVPTPTNIHYKTGEGTLYYLRWAEEIFEEGRVVAAAAPLRDLAKGLETWLRSRFVSVRGPRAFDNPAEYERLKGSL